MTAFAVDRDSIRRNLRCFAQPVTYLGLATLFFIGCALAFLIAHDRREAYRLNAQRGDNLVRIIEQSVTNILKRADDSILFLRKAYALNPSEFDLQAWARDTAFIRDIALDFTVVDANGRISASSYLPNSIGVDVSDRESFMFHVQSPDDVLYVGRPAVMKSSPRWTLVVTRRITTPDGRFGGVITGLIDPIELAKRIGATDLGGPGSVGVVGMDGYVRVRVVDGQLVVPDFGRKIPLGINLISHVARAPAGHYWNTPGILDDLRRLISYRRLEAFPLIAVVSTPEADVYEGANRNARIYFVIAGLLALATLFAIGLGAMRERKLLDATAKMKEVQDALLCSQERYTLVESAVSGGMWDWNLVTNEVYISVRWRRILGFAEDEHRDVRAAFFNLLHPDDKALVEVALRAHLEHDKPYDMDLRLRGVNGEYRWIHAHGKALRDSDGRPIRMVGAMDDIGERKRAEVAIERSRNDLARAEQMANLGHFYFEYASGVFNWSDSMYRILNKSRDFVPTLDSVMDIVHPEDRFLIEERRRDLAAGIEPPRNSMRVLGDDGTYRHIDAWVVPLCDDSGAVMGMFGSWQDITEYRRTEEALAKANHELEQRVAERTAELAQEMRRREEAQMKVAQSQRLNAVGQLTAGIAHDFNNLLAVIGGGLEFVERAAVRGLPAEPELIEASIRATRRGRELVQRMLTFARQSPLKAELTSIDRLVLDTLRLLRRTLGEEIDIETRLDAATAMVSVDRSQLTNALLNLTLNARDAMPTGGRLTIATACRPAEYAAAEGIERWPTGEEVRITVEDSGCGMTNDVQSRALEPFFTTKPDGLGSGLGLSMVHGFVEQSGGHISIESAVGRGTTITIRLPLIATTGVGSDARAPVSIVPGRKEKTVLLVEDDSDVRIVTSAQLKELGYNVHAVSNGLEAMDLIASPADIDLTLTDLVLPAGIDGVTLVEEAMRARPSMGVLCMTGYDPTQRHRKWLKLQNIELLEKPFSSTRLGRALEAALGQ